MSNPIPAEFEVLNEHHVAIATQLVAAVNEAQPEWDRCRLMLQWFLQDGVLASYGNSVRTLHNGRMGSLRWPAEHKEMFQKFYDDFQAATGERPSRFRITVDADGTFKVDYFYDEVRGHETWLWPDEDGYLTPAEVKALDFMLPEAQL